jgi:general stress protein 26
MSTDINNRAEVERRLWDEIEKHQTGMLGIGGGAPHHTQPMTAFAEPETGEIWFFSRDDTELVQEIGAGVSAVFVFQQKDVQACLAGRLSLHRDPARIDRYWNAVIAAWYPDGKEDPHLALIRMTLDDAQVWISQAGPARFAWEIAKANATHRAPDLGGRANLDFH